MAAAIVLLFVLSTWNTAQQPLPSCVKPALPCPATVQVTQEDAALAVSAGLPIGLLPVVLTFSVVARLSLGLVGLLIFWRKSDDWMAMLVSAALMTVLLEGSQGVPAGLAPVVSVIFGIGTALFLPMPAIFPHGRFQPSWVRWPLLLIATPFVILSMFFVDAPFYGTATAVVTLLWIIISLYAMPYRYFKVSTPIERQQTKWVLLGISVTFVTAIFYTTLVALYPASQPSPTRLILQLINAPLYAVGYGFFAFAMLRAMLRYRLWDIEIIIRRTLQYTLLTGLLALIYFGSVLLLQSVFTTITGQKSVISIVVSTLLMAAFFAPLRQRVQAFIDRRFYRQKYNAQQILAQFAQTARDEVALETLRGELVNVVQKTMQPEQITVWLRDS